MKRKTLLTIILTLVFNSLFLLNNSYSQWEQVKNGIHGAGLIITTRLFIQLLQTVLTYLQGLLIMEFCFLQITDILGIIHLWQEYR